MPAHVGYRRLPRSNPYILSPFTAANIPVLGGEIIPHDTGFESWDDASTPAWWSHEHNGTSTINREGTDKHAGSYAMRMDIDAGNDLADVNQAIVMAAGTWAKVDFWAFCPTATKTLKVDMDAWSFNPGSLPAVYTNYTAVLRAPSANPRPYISRASAASASLYLDDFSLKPFTLSTLYELKADNTPGGTFACHVTVSSLYLQGGMGQVDSNTNPLNGWTAYINNAQACLIKQVAGVVSEVITPTAISYVSGTELRVVRSGNNFSLYYNGTQVGTTQVIADLPALSYAGGFRTDTSVAVITVMHY